MSLEDLEAIKVALDAKVEAEKASAGVTQATAFAWWDVATAIRDIKEAAQ